MVFRVKATSGPANTTSGPARVSATLGLADLTCTFRLGSHPGLAVGIGSHEYSVQLCKLAQNSRVPLSNFRSRNGLCSILVGKAGDVSRAAAPSAPWTF